MRRASAVLLLALSACGSGDVVDLLQPDARQPCTLDLLGDAGEPLASPYVVTMQPVVGGPPAAEVLLKGSGWSGNPVEIRTTPPSGRPQEAGVDALSLNEGRSGQIFNAPGSWIVEFEDANCLQRVEVEVRPVAAIPTASPGSACGALTVLNTLDALAAGSDAETVILEEPFVATMGERTIGNEQVAALRFLPTEDWADPVIHLQISPGAVDDGVEIDNPGFNRGGWETAFGIPGQKRLVFTGMVTNCSTVVDLSVVLDTELRAKDVEAGLTEPPEPAGPPR